MQEKILILLEKTKKPLSRGEIAKKLHEEDLNKISHRINSLLKGRLIKCIEINQPQAMEYYHCKRSMRVYYV